MAPLPINFKIYFPYNFYPNSHRHLQQNSPQGTTAQETSNPRMCQQPSARCRNFSCPGFAQALALRPCEDRPNCELKRPRIPKHLRSTENYCPNCRGLTKRERKTLKDKMSKARRDSRAKSVKAQEDSGQVEQHGESSRTAENRGAADDGLLLHDDLISTSGETNPETDSQNEGQADLVGPDNEDDHFTNSSTDGSHGLQEIDPDPVASAFMSAPPSADLNGFLNRVAQERLHYGDPADIMVNFRPTQPLTNSGTDSPHGPQEINPGPIAPVFINAPPSADCNAFLDRVAQERLHYGDPADIMVNFRPTQPSFIGISHQDHQPATPPPTGTGMTDSLTVEQNATQPVNVPSPAREYATEPDATALNNLGATLPHFPSQTCTNLTHLPRNAALPHFPVRPSSPQVQIDHTPLQTDGSVDPTDRTHDTGIDAIPLSDLLHTDVIFSYGVDSINTSTQDAGIATAASGSSGPLNQTATHGPWTPPTSPQFPVQASSLPPPIQLDAALPDPMPDPEQQHLAVFRPEQPPTE